MTGPHVHVCACVCVFALALRTCVQIPSSTQTAEYRTRTRISQGVRLMDVEAGFESILEGSSVAEAKWAKVRSDIEPSELLQVGTQRLAPVLLVSNVCTFWGRSLCKHACSIYDLSCHFRRRSETLEQLGWMVYRVGCTFWLSIAWICVCGQHAHNAYTCDLSRPEFGITQFKSLLQNALLLVCTGHRH